MVEQRRPTAALLRLRADEHADSADQFFYAGVESLLALLLFFAIGSPPRIIGNSPGLNLSHEPAMAFPRFIVPSHFEFVLRHQPDVTGFELVETFLATHLVAIRFFAAGFRLDAGRFATCPAHLGGVHLLGVCAALLIGGG